MPFALKRPNAINPRVKEWKSHDPDGDGYTEIIKYKTLEIAEKAAKRWGPNVEVVEVPWSPTTDINYPDYDENYMND